MSFGIQLASLQIDGTRFTSLLGISAILAFGLVASWILVTYLKDASKKQTVLAAQEFDETQIPEKVIKDPKELFDEEVRKIEEECSELYEEAINTAKANLGELVTHARSSLRNISISYARTARNTENVHIDSLVKRYIRVCETQWSFFKSELGYISYNDIEPHIRMILSCQAMADQFQVQDNEEDIEMTPSMSRAQEILLLQTSLPSERMGRFQMESLEAVDPFKHYYNSCVKDWVNDCLFQIIAKIREKGEQGASLKDTDLRDRFVRFKNTIETMSRLSERVDSNMQEVGEPDAAFNQIIFGSVIMSILAHAPDWFPELGDSETEESESNQSSDTN